MSQSSQVAMLANHTYFVIVGDKFQLKPLQDPVVLVFYYQLYSEYRLLIHVLRITLLGLADFPSYPAKVKIQSLVWAVWTWSRGSCLPENNLFRSSHGSIFLTQSASPISAVGATCYAPNKALAAQVVYRAASSHELHLRFTFMEYAFQNILFYNKKMIPSRIVLVHVDPGACKMRRGIVTAMGLSALEEGSIWSRTPGLKRVVFFPLDE